MIASTILQYRILEKLGEGGMGIVYKALDTRLDRIVALKFLPGYLNGDDTVQLRFMQEAKAASAINHSNVCIVYDIEQADQVQFIAMEYIDGITLREKFRNAPLPIAEALSYAVQIGDGLAVAHGKGIVHRDVKPDNIMVTGSGQIKIMDFGLAKIKNAVLQTKVHSTLGTLSYMSPEQIEGSAVDHRADIFSFGIVLYEMLTQHLPFRGAHEASIMYSILHEDFLPIEEYLPEASRELRTIIARALQKDVQDRYQSIQEMSNDLRALSAMNDSASAGHQSLSGQQVTWMSSAKRRLFIGISVLCIVIASIYFSFSRFANPSVEYSNGQTVSAHDGSVSSIDSIVPVAQPLPNSHAAEHRKDSGTLRSVPPAQQNAAAPAVNGASADGMDRRTTVSDAQTAIPETVPVNDHFRIAVLPFANISPDAADGYFAEGMTEEIISTLSRIRDLRVIARTSSMQYKDSKKSIAEIGRELKANALIEGSVRKSGNKVRINVQLISTGTQEHLWSEEFDSDLNDIFVIQANVAEQVSAAMKVQLQSAEQQAIGRSSTGSTEAYMLYLQGRFYWNKRSPSDLLQSLDYFKRAVSKDADYALAHAGIADAYTLLGNYYILPPAEAYPKAKIAAQQALNIDPTLAEAHAALAFALMHYDWNWSEAEKEFLLAIELKPSYALAQSWYAYFLTVTGRFNEAVALRKRVQQLDPFSVVVSSDIGLTLYFSRNYGSTVDQFRKTLAMDPGFYAAYIPLGAALLNANRPNDAIVALKKGRLFSQNHSIASAALAYGYAVTGKRVDAQRIIDDLQKQSARSFVSPYWIGIIYAGLGDRNAAFSWFEKGIALHDGSMIFLKVEPILDSLRSDHRFGSLLARVGLNN